MGTVEIEIERHDRVTHGDYVAQLPDVNGTAKLSWTMREGVRHAEHTFVPTAARGRNIAAKLVEALVSDARSQGFKIAPDCSYVERYFDRHEELADLRA